MRWGVCLAVGLAATTAAADPRLEASGFLGVGYLGDDIQLGDSWAPEQAPGTAPLIGARLHVLVEPDAARIGEFRMRFGVEGETVFASAYTGNTIGMDARRQYYAPVLGWRAHGRVQLIGTRNAHPHLLAGIGGATVASESPYMRKETDPVFYWGAGVSIPFSNVWQIRVDLRHGVMAGKDHWTTSVFEAQFGLSASFDLPTKKPVALPPEPPPRQPPIDEGDTDHDGLPNRLDACPTEKEITNGIADHDGCPEADGDGDLIVGAADRCPSQAEDLDRFEDTDGCPDPDNDGDGVADAGDACIDVPETRNGFAEEDGCPDEVPAEVTSALTAALPFEPTRARVTPKARTALVPTQRMMRKHKIVRIRVIGHPEKAGNEDLARRRAEAVKWHLIDQGIAEDRIETAVGPVASSPAVELQLILR
ncbi:MAG: OmpA family protein [Deltaproteobacteria bacterium]|nr:OmpA family protein [Deltaproteobacteria bacterium]